MSEYRVRLKMPNKSMAEGYSDLIKKAVYAADSGESVASYYKNIVGYSIECDGLANVVKALPYLFCFGSASDVVGAFGNGEVLDSSVKDEDQIEILYSGSREETAFYMLVGCSGIVLGFSIDKLDIGFDPGDAEDIEYCFEE